MDQGGKVRPPAQCKNKDLLRLQLAAQLAAKGKGVIVNALPARASRAKVTRDPVGMRCVLVVDDEPSVLELVAASLEVKNYRVLSASSVAEARVALQSRSDISLVITDLHMPGEDGFVLLEFLRSNLRFHHIPVVVFTSCSDVRYVRRAIDLGAQAYLAKPFTSEDLAERVDGVLKSTSIVILLVSDNGACRTILGRDMTSAGYSVQTSESGAAGLETMRTGKVSLVICEFVLDDMTGLDMMEQASELSAGIPFLFISDPLLKVSDEVVKAAGGYGMIRRPFRNSEVIQIIRAMEPKMRNRAAHPSD